ncbi:MAG: molecular chaperone HtpG [Desulfuromonadales bacterium]|jgi:molecular chaperone HtpG|nr:molecular chaperone HtpG [Desulfuromonadales bacterium]
MADNAKMEKGQISIHTENIFPIIKKWLYSEKEIFLRELVSNAVDAIHKLQHVNLIEGLQLADEYAIDITVDKDAGTLSVKDNGIGMTADEVRKYINQVAFSSAEEFVEKFKDLEDKNQIIGHFGLGFYSAFMVADRVEIFTRSYQSDAAAVHWVCEGSTDYSLEECDKDGRGTEVVLHLNADEKEFLDPSNIRGVLKRFCNFLPVPIRLAGDVVNDRNPLWTRSGGEIKDEEYLEFYKKLYPLADEPLFWIHLNIDYPFNLKGLLYFPKLTTEFDVAKSHIKLFCNQVFVSDNCPELIPEFLNPLQGCLDAPDLPLNVSRSYLQNDPQVRKIRDVISSRIASKIGDLAKGDRENFVPVWENIHTFVKYGMMRDDKFYDKLKDHVIYRLAGKDEYTTLPEYLERAAQKHADKVFYTNNEAAQSTYLKLFANQGMEVLVLDSLIDSHFIQFLEMKNGKVTFQRVDSDLTENLIEEDSKIQLTGKDDRKERSENIRKAFEESLAVDGLSVRVENFKDDSVPGMVILSEHTRRLQEMSKMMGQGEEDAFGGHTLCLNAKSPVVDTILNLKAQGHNDDARMLMEQIYDLSMLPHCAFDKDRMSAFLERSNRILCKFGSLG